MIEKIKMKNVASYKQETILETDKRINLIYGLNGTGKTTISKFLFDKGNEKYKDCGIEGLEDSDSILVYNQNFVDDTFYDDKNIPGIFTLSKENKDISKEIDSLQESISDLKKKKEECEVQQTKNENEYKHKIEELYKETWRIKEDYSGGDRIFDYCLEGHKRSKEELFEFVKNKVKTTIDYTIEDLESELKVLIDNDNREISQISVIANDVENLNNNNLLSKVIVGNDNSSVSELINKLNNSDWVRKGLDYIDKEEENAICPFCQNKTITKSFCANLKNYFDDNYENDLIKLNELKENYREKSNVILKEIDNILNNEYLLDHKKDIENSLSIIDKTIKSNLNTIDRKIGMPSQVYKLDSINEEITKVNNIINEANNKIAVINNKIKEIDKSKSEISKKFWAIMRNDYDNVISNFNLYYKDFSDSKSKIDREIAKYNEDIIDKENAIKEKKEQMNANIPIDNINKSLIDMGITSFKVEFAPVEDDDKKVKYVLKRDSDNDENDIFETLSEGEKGIISFLYFIELCKGRKNQELSQTNKTIVIDDPISSLSHIYVFNVGRLIRNEIFKNVISRDDSFAQVFVFTHSLYFFYELTGTYSDKLREEQKLFRISKNEDGSSILEMKYEEIQNDYQAYWSIIKDKNQHPALIANCMRNVIEYFFNFVQKTDLNNVFQKAEFKNNRFDAFNRYINRESHSKGQNIFDIKEFDYDMFLEAFKLVFELSGYGEHYKKMIR